MSKADVRDFIGFSLFQYSSRTFPRIMAARVSRFSQAALRELFLAALSQQHPVLACLGKVKQLLVRVPLVIKRRHLDVPKQLSYPLQISRRGFRQTLDINSVLALDG